jgi:hypothetical protein
MRAESGLEGNELYARFNNDPSLVGLYIGGHGLPKERDLNLSKLLNPQAAVAGVAIATVLAPQVAPSDIMTPHNRLQQPTVATASYSIETQLQHGTGVSNGGSVLGTYVTTPDSQPGISMDMEVIERKLAPGTYLDANTIEQFNSSRLKTVDQNNGYAMEIHTEQVVESTPLAAPPLLAFTPTPPTAANTITKPELIVADDTILSGNMSADLPEIPTIGPALLKKNAPAKATPTPKASGKHTDLDSADALEQAYHKKYGKQTGHLPRSQLRNANEIAGSHQFAPDMATAMNALGALYKKHHNGHPLRATDSYRPYNIQVILKRQKPELAARPGTSLHGLGTATDLVVGGYNSSTYHWLKKYAENCGIYHPAWAEPNGSKKEPWHWELLGGDIADCGKPGKQAHAHKTPKITHPDSALAEVQGIDFAVAAAPDTSVVIADPMASHLPIETPPEIEAQPVTPAPTETTTPTPKEPKEPATPQPAAPPQTVDFIPLAPVAPSEAVPINTDAPTPEEPAPETPAAPVTPTPKEPKEPAEPPKAGQDKPGKKVYTYSPDAEEALDLMEGEGGKWVNRAKTLRHFMTDPDAKLDSIGAAAIAGNWMVESNVGNEKADIDPHSKQLGGGPGRGVAQWSKWDGNPNHSGRYDHDMIGGKVANLLGWAKQEGLDPNKLETQFQYTDYEGTEIPPYSHTMKEMRKVDSVSDGVITFEQNFERAGHPAHGARIKAAKLVHSEFLRLMHKVETTKPDAPA